MKDPLLKAELDALDELVHSRAYGMVNVPVDLLDKALAEVHRNRQRMKVEAAARKRERAQKV